MSSESRIPNPESRSQSPPEPEPGHEPGTAGRLASLLRQFRRALPLAGPHYSQVRRELAPELVPQTQSDVGRGETGAQVPLRIRLTREIHLDAWLQDPPIRQQQLVVQIDARLRSPVGADVTSGFDLEPVRCQSLHAHRGPRLGITPVEVLTHAGDQIPPSGKLPSPQHMRLPFVRAPGVAAPLRPQPDTVAIAADPGDGTHAGAVCRLRCLPPQPLDEHEGANLIGDRRSSEIRKRGLPIGI